MPRKVIKCTDFEEQKYEREESGRFIVYACKPLPNQSGIPEIEKLCKIKWRPRPLRQS